MEGSCIKVAFYKGNSGRLHKIIRWWTKSKYSHAELIMPDGKTWISISPFLTSRVSARCRDVIENPEMWDYLTFDLNWRQPVQEYQASQLQKFISETTGCKYDWIGMLLSQFGPFLIKRRDRWYCSEWIAYALRLAGAVENLYHYPDLTPQRLHEVLKKYADES